MSRFCDYKRCKTWSHVLSIPFKVQKPTIMLFRGDGTLHFAEKRVAITKKKYHFYFLRIFSINHNQTHPNLNQKSQKIVQIMS